VEVISSMQMAFYFQSEPLANVQQFTLEIVWLAGQKSTLIAKDFHILEPF
jgi:hypothetical protein